LACKKKLYDFLPHWEPQEIQTCRTRERYELEPCDPGTIERNVRQLLADKVSGNLVGLWLLIPEHLRLGTWDLLLGWSRRSGQYVEPRLALQLVHEAAVCVTRLRDRRALSQKGFELANGLHVVASDVAVHYLLNAHTVAEAQALQIALGKIRSTFGHFKGRLLAADPHRIRSYSKRQARRHQLSPATKPAKCAQTFFLLDTETHQPICFTLSSSSQSVTQATPELLRMGQEILRPTDGPPPLVMADSQHYAAELIDYVAHQTPFELLVPMPNQEKLIRQWKAIPEEKFVHRWAGLSIAKTLYHPVHTERGPYYQVVQRCGEKPDQYHYKGFLATADRDELKDLTENFPDRWHVEEFFNIHQPLGWNRAGTLNLNIRYGQMSMALLAQAALFQLRQKLPQPQANWSAKAFARDFLKALEGDIRVVRDTIVVTYYNAPNPQHLASHYQNLPEKLCKEGVDPRIPWLYNFKLDFRFK